LLRHSQGDKTKYETYLHSRPRSFEKTAVRMLMEVMQQGVGKPAAPGFGLHIVHLTDSDLLPELAVAKSAGADCMSDLQKYVFMQPHKMTLKPRGSPARRLENTALLVTQEIEISQLYCLSSPRW